MPLFLSIELIEYFVEDEFLVCGLGLLDEFESNELDSSYEFLGGSLEWRSEGNAPMRRDEPAIDFVGRDVEGEV